MQRAADVFVVTRRSWQSASIAHVLALRQDAVRKAPASSQGRDAAAVILDRGARFRIEKILFQEWMQEPETQERARGAWQRALLTSLRSHLRLEAFVIPGCSSAADRVDKAMGDADATSEALGANNPLACLFAVCPFDPAKVMPMEFDFRPHMIDNKVKDQESGKSKDAGDQANASPGKSKETDKESGKRKDKGDHPAAS